MSRAGGANRANAYSVKLAAGRGSSIVESTADQNAVYLRLLSSPRSSIESRPKLPDQDVFCALPIKDSGNYDIYGPNRQWVGRGYRDHVSGAFAAFDFTDPISGADVHYDRRTSDSSGRLFPLKKEYRAHFKNQESESLSFEGTLRTRRLFGRVEVLPSEDQSCVVLLIQLGDEENLKEFTFVPDLKVEADCWQGVGRHANNTLYFDQGVLTHLQLPEFDAVLAPPIDWAVDRTLSAFTPLPHGGGVLVNKVYCLDPDNRLPVLEEGSSHTFRIVHDPEAGPRGWKLETLLSYDGGVLETFELIPGKQVKGSAGFLSGFQVKGEGVSGLLWVDEDGVLRGLKLTRDSSVFKWIDRRRYDLPGGQGPLFEI